MNHPRYTSHFTPFDTARPVPSEADKAEAERRYDAFDGRWGMAHDRADYVARIARAVMQSRMEAEHRAQFRQPKARAA